MTTPTSAFSPSPTTAPPAPKRLYRSRDDRMLGGVCGGLGAYFGIDPTLVRILAVVSLFLPGPQLIAYVVAWIIVPEEPAVAAAPAPATTAPAPAATTATPPAATTATPTTSADGEAGPSSSSTTI